MSNWSVTGEQSTTTEIAALTDLTTLAISGVGEFIRKTGTNTFENATPADSGGGTWGSITGALSDQTDLQSALNLKATVAALALKAPLASPVFTTQITTPLIYGSSAANGDITIEGTSDATKTTSYVILQPTGGNVGIGTTGPNNLLELSSSLTSGTVLRINNTDTGGNYWRLFSTGSGNSPGAGSFGIVDSGSTYRFLINTNGNVGIGTTSPGGGLDVSNGGLSLVLGADNGATTRTNNADKLARIGIVHYINGEYPLAMISGSSGNTVNYINIGGGTSLMKAATVISFFTAANTTTSTGTTRMTIDTTGNVGIGTTSPGARLDVSPTITATTDLKGTLSGLVYNGATAMTNYYGHYIAAPTGTGTITNKYALVTEANAGNVGIGLTSPTAYLHMKAGTATTSTAPIKLTAGVVNTTPEAGAIEFDGVDFFLVI